MKEIEQEYKELLKSGMFWEFFPNLTGEWNRDESTFTKFYEEREYLKSHSIKLGAIK